MSSFSVIFFRALRGRLVASFQVPGNRALYDPVYRPIDIDADMYLWAGEPEDTVRARIEQGLEDFFAFGNVDFDQDVHFSDLVALLDGIRGVSHVHLQTPADDVLLNCGEIPALGQMQLRLRRAS
jgi:hypothetical protein